MPNFDEEHWRMVEQRKYYKQYLYERQQEEQYIWEQQMEEKRELAEDKKKHPLFYWRELSNGDA